MDGVMLMEKVETQDGGSVMMKNRGCMVMEVGTGMVMDDGACLLTENRT